MSVAGSTKLSATMKQPVSF